MKLLNRQYIKVDRFSIFMEMAKDMGISKDKKRKMFFQKLHNVINEYQKNNKGITDEVYISVDELCAQNLFSINDIPIARAFDSISFFNNALFLADNFLESVTPSI